MALTDIMQKIAQVDLFERDSKTGVLKAGIFVGHPFYLDYTIAHLVVADAWKLKAKGLPQGSFLLAYYENEEHVNEALLLRVLGPTRLPTDNDVISSMVEYYKDNLKTSGKSPQLDTFTRYEFSFSGVQCRILGTFYLNKDAKLAFGADVENFYSAHNYTVIKPKSDILELIVNFREGGIVGTPNDIKLGRVRYSSSRRFQEQEESIPVYVSPKDFLGKRTALFGMTRTGKSNTVKKIIEATVLMSKKAPFRLADASGLHLEENLEPFTNDGIPKFPVGQIIFDVNGEYANANLQDAGTAIFEMFADQVTRYSVLQKEGFKIMKVNFYNDVAAGFELVKSFVANEGDYVKSFLAIDLTEPEDKTDFRAKTRYERKLAAYRCCLYRANFTPSVNYKVKFEGNGEINKLVKTDGDLDPSKGITLEQATNWFLWVWDNYEKESFFSKYKNDKGNEWADEDLKALMVFLSRKTKSGGGVNVNGFMKLRGIRDLHTETVGIPFDKEIVAELRQGRIVIIDLSQGDPEIQNLYSERICRQLFIDSMDKFIKNQPNNIIHSPYAAKQTGLNSRSLA